MLGVAVVTGGPCDRSAVSEAGSGRDEVREVAWATGFSSGGERKPLADLSGGVTQSGLSFANAPVLP